MIWDHISVNITILQVHPQFIHFVALASSNTRIYVTLVYEASDNMHRKERWETLCEFSTSITNPWITGGDFNRVDERIGGDQVLVGELLDFTTCIDDCGVQDMKWLGHFFTWRGKQGPTRVFSRLDRVLVNGEGIRCFTGIYHEALSEGVSDHSP